MINAKELEDRLQTLLEQRAEVEQRIAVDGEKAAHPYANYMLREACNLAAAICGKAVMTNALRVERDDLDHLEIIYHRLLVTEAVLSIPRANTWSKARDDAFTDLKNEVIAVLSGDAPRLFAARTKRKGQQQSMRTRAASHHLEALRWLEYLDASGCTPAQRDTRFTSLYCLTKDSIRKWRTSCAIVYGEEKVAEDLRLAREAALDAPGSGLRRAAIGFNTESIEQAAELYRADTARPE